MNSESLLTRERPDIWARGLALAHGLTGYRYEPKLPLPDGTIYACGGGYYPSLPDLPATPEEIKKEELDRIDDQIGDCERDIAYEESEIADHESAIDIHKEKLVGLKKKLKELKKNRGAALAGASVFVPDGAMEWLLHEVGHYIAATPDERKLPNYGLSESEVGHDGEREWEAWAFEEIVLAPFGPSREFAPPTQRDGAGYTKAGPMPQRCLDHVERQMRTLGLDAEMFRVV